MGQTFGTTAKLAALSQSKRYGQYVPARGADAARRNKDAFRRDRDDRDKLGVRVTSLAVVAASKHLAKTKTLLNEAGEFETRKGVAGDGLYARVDIPRFAVIGEYIGKVIHDERDARGESTYRLAAMDLPKGKRGAPLYTIDGEDGSVSSIVRYANAMDAEEEMNAEFVQFPGPNAPLKKNTDMRVFLVAARDIKRKEEILTWYGEDTQLLNTGVAPTQGATKAKKRTGPGLYELDRIVGHKTVRGRDVFNIRWKGYGKADDTWEPEGNLPSGEVARWKRARR
jgi:hypothetical protein